MTTTDNTAGNKALKNDSGQHGWKMLKNPVVLIALIITAGVFVLIGAAMLGWDHGLLRGMADAEFARGLITYLFAVVTIGTAVILVVYSLTNSDNKRFQKGKEVLSLLLGVFGTIVGFYFGSEVGAKESDLNLAPPILSQPAAESGGVITLTSSVTGGKPPYRYGIQTDGNDMEFEQYADDSGWIITTFSVKKVTEDEIVNLRLGVKDQSQKIVVKSVRLHVSAKSSDFENNN